MNNNYLSDINPRFNDAFIQEMKAFAAENHVPIMQDDGIHFLIQLLKINHATHVLEIGTAIGYSAILMATYAGVKVLTIERNQAMVKQAKANIEKANLSNQIEIIYGDAKDIDLNDQRFDMVFIDAAKSSYIEFFEKFAKHVQSGGMIVSDNLLFRGYVEHPEHIQSRNRKQLVKKINRYNHFLINHPDFDSYIYPIGDGVSISIKK